MNGSEQSLNETETTNFQPGGHNIQPVLNQKPPEIFKPLEPVMLGVGDRSMHTFIKSFKKNGCKITDPAYRIISQHDFEPRCIPLKTRPVSVTVAGLGFKDGAFLVDILSKAAEYGLEICPMDFVMAFRTQYTNQPASERLRVVAEVKKGAYNKLVTFIIKKIGYEPWVLAFEGDPNHMWGGNIRFVFLLTV